MMKLNKALKEHLEEQKAKWLKILNERYETDAGTPLTDYAKGRLTAYVELTAWIEDKEKKHGRSQEEEGRTGEKARKNAGHA